MTNIALSEELSALSGRYSPHQGEIDVVECVCNFSNKFHGIKRIFLLGENIANWHRLADKASRSALKASRFFSSAVQILSIPALLFAAAKFKSVIEANQAGKKKNIKVVKSGLDLYKKVAEIAVALIFFNIIAGGVFGIAVVVAAKITWIVQDMINLHARGTRLGKFLHLNDEAKGLSDQRLQAITGEKVQLTKLKVAQTAVSLFTTIIVLAALIGCMHIPAALVLAALTATLAFDFYMQYAKSCMKYQKLK